MPQPEQNDDIWSRAVTVGGFRVDEVRSVLQKSIRRGLVEEAALAAYELFRTGVQTEELLWRRLEIIAVEDVGAGLPAAPSLLHAMNEQRVRQTTDLERWMYSAHAVKLLASAPKDRSTMELAFWASVQIDSGERSVEILDMHVDHHTRRGVKAGRDTDFWWAAGGYKLVDEIDPDGSPWSAYVRSLLGGDGHDPAAEGGYSSPYPGESIDDALDSMP
ncbi:AAA family ATPase [Rhodococcus sp. 14-2470-1b]|jgi:replication-associated recombination protein RarA|uniref:AAA family ATPase n=1 Tax=unclassified Rhodococcus (in: high G+C Gram-positive bacteria) TaxID=192944 RepID=UPI0011406AF0|nr:AAA family ATPase [Rhodococcus sp. 14-2470-1b]